jgi:ribonucleoside-diphosphate reductase alpha chain
MTTTDRQNGHNTTTSAQELLAALQSQGLITDNSEVEAIARGLGVIEGAAMPATDFAPANITDNAMVVLEKRYLRKDGDNNVVEDPDGMFRRVADALAEADRAYGATDAQIAETAQSFYETMASLDYLPNSPTMMNAGTGAGTLSACFVLPLKDTMEGIMDAAKDTAMVQKFGGGTGFTLSEIRPKGSHISTTHGKACGPIAVLRHLSSVSTLVTQGGKRDGANMAVMDVHHPDIMEFIDCKETEGDIHNFNISVGASDAFMQAVKDGTDYSLHTQSDPNDDSTRVETGRLDAREVFSKIVYGAWRNGEPGMIFLDEVNRNSPVAHLGRITATNPCGEQPLLENESCNLGSINLAHFITEDETDLEWDQLGKITRTTIHMLDNVIDVNAYAVAAIEEVTRNTRKLGLGVMGFADMLIQMGIAYDSDEGVDMGRKIMAFILEQADLESLELATVRGPFPAWEGSPGQQRGDTEIRNACRLTVAPTGTISMIAGASSGIEPIFSLVYRKHNILNGETLFYIDKNFEAVAHERGFYSEDLMEFLADGGSLQDREDVPEDVRDLFHVSSDISPEFHVRMQAAFQESVDAGISKTVNFPNEATLEDVETAYMMSWELKCKGITVYRAGSRDKEVLTSGTNDASSETTEVESVTTATGYMSEQDRPAELTGVTRRVRTGHGNMYITVTDNEDGRPFEMFSTLGKAGGCDAAQHEAIGRLASLAMRSGVDPDSVVESLRGITCCPTWDEGVLVRSGPDAMAIALDKHLKKPLRGTGQLETREPIAQLGMSMPEAQPNLGGVKVTISEPESEPGIVNIGQITCPECEQPSLAFEEGCQKCYSCGYSKC